ncbi:MAG: hypothetical protein A3D74_05565 [Candidatus Levybacteria bacterium RIFCSPHIGHO2_02_FULL_37_13]|nr:MAG: hypothetical protein A3D74_05565 [Candidatus Levybacteria bacterium RIFCSPHIGHO2_02_FULL_37_13]OGH29119.1 MAG: hypothetical protein A3E40_03165 [Candidatus Levybacteria bacterium RIFCSPHIGHO2_12_FULL_37_9]OGH40412.1 MAG: hypothetical protein A3B41_02790 [Candidatus Levybacteria bacterium RIFCSPLOWO2_01_FULL_37_26]
MIKVNKNLFLFSGLFISFTGILLAIFQKFLPFFPHAIYYCQSFINSSMIQMPLYLNFVPFLLLFGFVSVLGLKLVIFYFRSQSLKSKLKSKIIVENQKEKTVIIKSTAKFAFCLGIIKPKIYISSNLILKLSKKELRTVVEHERYHLERGDTLINLIVFIVGSLSFAFPLINDLIKNYKVRREIEADNFAVAKIGDSRFLVSALKKILVVPAVVPSSVASIMDHDTLEERIYALLSKQRERKKVKLLNLFISIASIGIVALIVLVPIHVSEAHYDNHDFVMICATSKLYSEMPSSYTPSRQFWSLDK